MLPEEEVVLSFRYILGREPESEQVIKIHQNFASRDALRHALINCKEFEQKNKRNLFPREKWVSATVYNGSHSMWLDLSDEYVSLGCLHDNYEPVETAFIRHNVSAGMVACDIGANIGWHTLGLAQCVGSEGAVYSFEPRRPTVSFLRKTVIDNQLEQVVQVRDCAIWDRAEILELNRIEGANNPGGSFLSAEGVTSTSQKIEALPLDQAIPDNVSFVKIDIEGAEYNAFYGSEKFKSFRPLVLSEIHATQLRKVSRITPDGYIGFLASLGYDCFSLMPHNYGQRIPRWTEGERIASVAFVPSNRSVTF